MDPSAPPHYPGVPYPNNNEQSLYPLDNRPGFGSTQPYPQYPPNNTLPPQQTFPPQPQPPAFPQQRGLPQPGVFPPQGQGYPPAPVFHGTRGAPQQMIGYPQQGGNPYPPPPPGYSQARGYPGNEGYMCMDSGVYRGQTGHTDMAMAAGMGALTGLAGAYLADKTPTMQEMAVGAGVGGAVGLAGYAATSDGAMSALGLAGHDMGDMQARKRAKYRFASKTIMRILPPAKKTEVEGLIASNAMTMDLYEILGKCTWTQPK